MHRHIQATAICVVATALVGLIAEPTARAKRPLGPPVNTAGSCSDGTSTFTLKSMFDDTPFPDTVGAEFQVNTGVVGQTWQVTLSDNGATFFNAPVQTTGPEGALNVTHPDHGSFAIDHTIVAQAVNAKGGATCLGQVTVPALR